MDIKQCEYFAALAEADSLSEAATRLFISKQGLSRSIQSLEAELGTEFFTRTQRGTELTEAGAAILPEIRQILLQRDRLMAKLQKEKEAELHILFSFGFFLCLPLDFMISFMEKNHDVNVKYSCCSDTEIEEKLLSGNYDLAFCSNVQQNERLDYTFLFRNYRAFIVHSEDPLAQKQLLDIEDIKDYSIAVSAPDQYNDYQYLQRIFAPLGAVPSVFPCYESSTLLEYAEARKGISLGVANLGKKRPSTDTRYAFLRSFKEDSYIINIVTRKDLEQSPAVRDFIRYMQNYCNSMLEARETFPLDS